MPTTDKKRDERIQVLHKCLKNSRVKWTRKKLYEKVNEHLRNNFTTPVSERTILDDINYLEYKGASIERKQEGKNVYYYYSDDYFELHAPVIDKDEYLSLAIANDVLNNLKGFPVAKDLKRILEKLQHQIEEEAIPISTYIQFEEQPELKNIGFLQEIFESIKEQTVLSIQYKGFHSDEIITKTIHPYLLKQYNKRWFLFGYDAQQERIDNSPLDRIIKIKPTSTAFIQLAFDAATYFKDIVGVTKYADAAIEKVVFTVSKERADYVLSKPFHSTQQVVAKNEDGSIALSIQVIPNNELLQQFLSFGKDLKVMAPHSLVQKIKEELVGALVGYG